MDSRSGVYVIAGFAALALLLALAAYHVFFRDGDEAAFNALSLEERMAMCRSLPNGSSHEVRTAERLFINLPEDIYPYAHRSFVFEGARAALVPSGEALCIDESFKRGHCVTHLYEFSGEGSVELVVSSARHALPEYRVYVSVVANE